MINNIKGEKRIDLSYSIQNFDSDKEIAVIRMLSDNIKYEILKLRLVMEEIVKWGFWHKLPLLPLLSCANAIDEN